ncbi:hypothetical protein SAMN05443287_108132 [Micromonospora phaseoli]|uniref:Uncharacterized protein n=1 Tax=Micromonospora phaseoli TaxID=1144548 RepID=A0A1H7BZJ1_9ACTN|nr:hypothetical protein CLV64_110152 [Micromonospora phaseoli]SEJ82798.1 hypothetical protein SAMN05443287_108132 [Micromonospora phaseoli]
MLAKATPHSTEHDCLQIGNEILDRCGLLQQVKRVGGMVDGRTGATHSWCSARTCGSCSRFAASRQCWSIRPSSSITRMTGVRCVAVLGQQIGVTHGARIAGQHPAARRPGQPCPRRTQPAPRPVPARRPACGPRTAIPTPWRPALPLDRVPHVIRPESHGITEQQRGAPCVEHARLRDSGYLPHALTPNIQRAQLTDDSRTHSGAGPIPTTRRKPSFPASASTNGIRFDPGCGDVRSARSAAEADGRRSW